MNNLRQAKPKKQSLLQSRYNNYPHLTRQNNLARLPPGHCQPKTPPNITQFQQFTQPRRIEFHKQNTRNTQNQQNQIKDLASTRNILLQPKKHTHGDSVLRKTQKKHKKSNKNQQWLHTGQQGLGCHEHLSSQIFRTLSHSNTSHRRCGTREIIQPQPAKFKDSDELLADFQKDLPALLWKEQQESLSSLVKLEQKYNSWPNYPNYLTKQTEISWKRRAIVLDWLIQTSSEKNCRRQTFGVAVNLLDRYLAIATLLPIERLQLVSTACLLIAQKIEDNGRIAIECFYQPISEGHTLEQLKQAEEEIMQRLGYRLCAPTINGWAVRLCAQWDLWAERQHSNIAVRFKSPDVENYQNWRTLAQYLDFALLDIQTLQYKNRTLAAAFLYLTLLTKLNHYSAQQIALRFRMQSSLILQSTPFNELYSRFLMESFNFPLSEILPTVQYCSGFVILPLRFQEPQLLQEKQMSYEEYCGIQTWNCAMKPALDRLDRNMW